MEVLLLLLELVVEGATDMAIYIHGEDQIIEPIVIATLDGGASRGEAGFVYRPNGLRCRLGFYTNRHKKLPRSLRVGARAWLRD